MKKNYKKFMLASMLLVGSLAATAQGDPAIVLKNFAPADVSSGALYSNAGNGITVSVSGGSVRDDIVGSVACLSINSAFTALTLNAGGYIDILNNGAFIIEKVEYSGSSLASASSYPVVAVSLTGGAADTNFPGVYFWENVGMPTAPTLNVAKALGFPTSQVDACLVAAYLIPETAYQGALPVTPKTEIANFDSQVKAIRLKWATSGNFATVNFSSSNNSAPNIFGIKIYFKDVSTGVREVKEAVGKVELSSSFIDLTGKPTKATAKGLLIKRTVYDDGSVEYTKKPLQIPAP
ncbi:hypothetical protein [Viscerimonas tarda]